MSFTAWLITTVIGVINMLISVYTLVVFVYFITRLLVNFGGVSSANPVVQFILQVGTAVVEPVLRPIRRVIPPVGGLDLSLIVLGVGLYVLQEFLGFVALNAMSIR